MGHLLWQAANVSFINGMLLLMQATLAELNKRLQAQSKEPLPMDRFRGNIVVTDCHACEEDEWEQLAIGGTVEVTAVKPCDRCKVSTAALHIVNSCVILTKSKRLVHASTKHLHLIAVKQSALVVCTSTIAQTGLKMCDTEHCM